MEFELPMTEEEVRKLKVGNEIYLTGTVVTARDAAHNNILNAEAEVPAELKQRIVGGAIFHCGPLIAGSAGEWKVLAAGPTTSMRMEPFAPDFINRYTPRVLIGKGGMGQGTAEAMKRCGCIYAQFPGGAAVAAAEAIERVTDVYWLEELGMAEAVWVFEMNKFGPLIVTIDAKHKT